MDEDQYSKDQETMIVENMNIIGLKLYKCYKVNDKLDGQVLFIFRLHTLAYTGQVGPLTDRLIQYGFRCTQQCMDSSWLSNLGGECFRMSVQDITSRANIFSYREAGFQFACDLTRLIRSCYRFSEGILGALNEDSLVFVVDVVKTSATYGLIEAMQRTMLLINEANACDYDYKSVVRDFRFEDDTEEEVVVVEDEDEEMLDCETDLEKMVRNDIIDVVRNWQELPNNFEPILEEIKPLITYEELDCYKIGNDYLITKKEEKRGECAICLTPYTGKVRHGPVFTWHKDANACKLVRLGCGHSFHHRCIFKWLDKNQTCPLCRSVSYVTV